MNAPASDARELPPMGTGDGASGWPLVSVIMPVYNCAEYVQEAIESVFNQEYPNLELLVVDDQSTDATVSVVASFGDRLTLLRQPNGGPAAARNRGARAARGEYLAFLDGDDVWLPGKLKAQMSVLRAHPDCRWIYGGFKRWPADAAGHFPSAATVEVEPLRAEIAEEHRSLYCTLLLGNVVHIITAVIHRSLFDTLGGFDETLRVGEEYDFWIKASRRFAAYRIQGDVALYRINQAGTTWIPRANNSEYRVVERAISSFGVKSPTGDVLAMERLQRRMRDLCFMHGYVHFWRGDPCIAARSFRAGLEHSRQWTWRLVAYAVLATLRCGMRHLRVGRLIKRRAI